MSLLGMPGRRLDERGMVGLIALLVVVAIGVILMYVLLGPMSKKSGGGYETNPGRAMDKGREVECESNLRQIRGAIEIYRTEHDSYPPTTADISLGVSNPAELMKCPVGAEPYAYDPATGRIQCPHPGHESF